MLPLRPPAGSTPWRPCAVKTISVRPAVIIDGMRRHLGFGMTAQRDLLAVESARLGQRLEALGYDELWANDGRLGSGLATLAAAIGVTSRIDLCVGVIPLSERTTDSIASEVASLGIPHERLVLGLGTGSSSSLALIRDAVMDLRTLLPDVRLAIAALGPRMCRLGGEVADLVLLNWASPERITWARTLIDEGARDAERPTPRVAGYVRVAIGSDAGARLTAEADRYRGRPRPYTRLFDAQEVDTRGIPGIATDDPRKVAALLEPYRAALDSCVVRALPADPSMEGWLAVAEAATLPS